MTTPLESNDSVKYSAVIDGILAEADLATISRKKIRQALEAKLGLDLSNHKDAVRALIEARFDAVSNEKPTVPENCTASPRKRPASVLEQNHCADTKDNFDAEQSTTPPARKKKRYTTPSLEEKDARLAARLQAEENSLGRARKTRGGGTSGRGQAASKRAQARKKTKVGARSGEPDDSEKPVKRKAGGFRKPLQLSPPLAELVGSDQLSRFEVVKLIWQHIKANELQDPDDRRHILCDNKMASVFKMNRMSMFHMNQVLGEHLYPVESE